MNLEISGKIISILEKQAGQSARGAWQKQSFVIETFEQYPKNVCIMLWNEKADLLQKFPEGSSVKASINIESREYNGKWYTDVKAWKVEALAANGDQDAPPPTYEEETPIPPDFQAEDGDAENLPF